MKQPHRKIKVLHVITRLVVGGAQENTVSTVKLLDPEKFETILVSGPSDDDKEGSLESDVISAGINIVIIKDLVREPSLLKDISSLVRLFCLMKKNGFDIVHTHCSKAGILGRMAAKLAGVPIIIHTPHGHVFYGYFNKIVSWFFIVLERFAGLFTDRIITLTDKGKKEHIHYKIAKPEKFITIYSGIDLRHFVENKTDRAFKKKELHLKETDFIIGTIARLSEIKGIGYLINAAPDIVRHIPDAKLLLVGDGPLKNELINLSINLKVDKKVQFLGLRKDISEIISIMDIFVLPSLNEGMGKVFLQVQAVGKPIVATDVGGVREIVKDGENGIVIPPRDSSAIAGACVKLFKNGDLRSKMGENGRASIDHRYSVETMVDNIESLYDEMIEIKSRKMGGVL